MWANLFCEIFFIEYTYLFPGWMTKHSRKHITTVCCEISAILLTHLPLVPHICVSESVTIDSDNGLSPNRRQAII